MTHINKSDLKGDRALELLEKGLTRAQICQRLGCNKGSLGTLLKNALARRERLKETA